jgi:hypothetical protein
MEEENFDRRRRNLIVVSLALCVAIWTGIRFTRLNLLGVDVDVQREWSLAFFLWFFWGYFLFRFWQAFKIIEINNPFMTSVDMNSRVVARRLTLKRHKASVQPGERVQVSEMVMRERTTMGGWREIQEIYWTPQAIDDRGVVTRNLLSDPHTESLPRSELRKLKRRACVHVTITTSPVADQIFPFVVAMAPLVLWLITPGPAQLPECLAGSCVQL